MYYIMGMKRQQTLKRSVAALAVASLVAGTQLAVTGPADAGGYRHHGGSYSYSFGYHSGYKPHYRSYHGYPRHYRHGYRYKHHGYRRGHHGYRYSHHGHGSDGALVVGALGAGLLLGYLITRPQHHAPTYSHKSTTYVQPSSPAYGYSKTVRRDCKPTTGNGLHQGRPATFGGTFCYDANGRGYIVPGSEYLIGYTN